MAKLNLEKLSAPVEALRPVLAITYEQLDAQWDEVLEALKKLPIPATVSVTTLIDRDGIDHKLHFGKLYGERRIWATWYCDGADEGEIIRYEEWSGTQRRRNLLWVDALFTEALEVTKRFIEAAK